MYQWKVSCNIWSLGDFIIQQKTVMSQASTYWYILSQINFKMYILCTYKYENPVLVHFTCTSTYSVCTGTNFFEGFRPGCQDSRWVSLRSLTSANHDRVTIIRDSDYVYFNRLYAIITIIYNYIRLFAIILLQKPKRLYPIISKDDHFTYCTTIISLNFFLHILLPVRLSQLYTIMCIIFFRKLLYVLFYLRWIIAILFSDSIMCIMRIISLYSNSFCLTNSYYYNDLFFQCYYTHHFFPNTFSSL